MTATTPRGRHRSLLLGVSAVAVSLVLAACGGSSDTSSSSSAPATSDSATASASESSSVDSAAVAATIKKAFQTDVDQASLDPLIVEALTRASQPLTDAQLDTAFQCWSTNSCDVPGGGDITVGIADGFGDNTWRKLSKMEAILQALTYPEVGKIVYTNASGDLAKMQSNVRSLSAQGAQVILTYDDFGPAMTPGFAAAQSAGATVASYVGPVPDAPTSAVALQVTSDVCAVGTAMADKTAELLGSAGGDIAFFNGTPGNPQGQAWNKCAEDQLASKYPNVKVVAKEDTNWTPDGAYKAASALIGSGKDVKAILYDYADPMPQIAKAYTQAGKASPAMVTWTMNNDLNKTFAEADGTDKAFALSFTNGLNWAARVSLTGAMKIHNGESINSPVIYPMPFVTATKADWAQDKPGDFVGSAIIPDALLAKIFAG
ncbi:MAG: substrate-binding domain-containing protein [Candidatus Nanopelagicales bacterium]